MCAPDSYAQKGGRGGKDDKPGQSAASNAGNPGRGTSAPTGGGISNPVGGAMSRQSLSGSNSAKSDISSSIRSSDGNRGSVSQGTDLRARGNDARDAARVQSNISINTPGSNSIDPKLNPPTDAQRSSTSQDAGRRQQQSFFRGPTDRSRAVDRDNIANRIDDNRKITDRNFNNRDNVASRDIRDRNLDNRVRDDRNRSVNDRNRFDSNDWSRMGRVVTSDFARRDVLPFSVGWWNNFPHDRWPASSPFLYSRWRDRPYYWWGTTPANRLLTNWFVFGWDRPRYWGYGPGANIYYQDDFVYYDGNRYAPVADYYQQVYDLAHSAPAIDPAQAEGIDWAPLGVFAAARNDSSQERTIQLAVNKDGVLAGTYFNPRNDTVHPLTGMVDGHSQRAAWTFADDEHKGIVFETSVFNLTKPESTVMVHYGPAANDTEVWQLVRLEQPEQGDGTPRTAYQRDLP